MTNSPIRLSQVDETNRDSHAKLTDRDVCLYLYEKTSGKDYSFSSTNNLISNLKKPVNSSSAILRYKSGAIRQCAQDFASALNREWLRVSTLVPVPPSKMKSDPLYDDRMDQVCRLIAPGLDVRNLVVQDVSMVANHARDSENRVTVEELIQAYSIDESETAPAPTSIGIFDDMLTAGTHFRAMHTVLSSRFPTARIVGLFVARRIFPDD